MPMLAARTPNEIASLWDRLSLRQRVARLLLVRSTAGVDGLPDGATLAAAEAGVGAFHGPPLHTYPGERAAAGSREFLAILRRRAHGAVGLPPLIGANAETGLAYTTGGGGTDVPYPAALGQLDPASSRAAGRTVGADLRACGYDWGFGPVADLRVTTDDPVIGVRAFGSDPEQVAAHAREYGLGLQEAGVLATVKHLPGHGDATVDSHLGLPVIRRSEQEQRRHLGPFIEASRAGLASMMTAHLTFEGRHEGAITTFNPDICTDLLRRDLGFSGLLVSDSLRMAAVADRYTGAEASVLALTAGCDVANVKCLPEHVNEVLDGLEAAVGEGRLSEDRIYQAFTRVLAAPLEVRTSTDEVPALTAVSFAGELAVGTAGEPVLDVGDQVPVTVVMSAPAGEAPDADAFAATLSRVTGREIHVQYEFSDDLDAAVVLSYGPAGPTPRELETITRAEASQVPAVVFLAGAPDLLPGYTGSLPAVSVPALDVFGMPSVSAFAAGLGRILNH